MLPQAQVRQPIDNIKTRNSDKFLFPHTAYAHTFLLTTIISQAMPTLIELMKDPSVVVRDTAAWTVGRICEMLPEAAINDIYLAPLLQCLIEGLSAEPRVASNVCWVRQTLCFCC